jgi:Protein of unknown function (DUF3768)
MTIAELNDAFRRSFTGGQVVVTPGIRALPWDMQAAITERVRSFEEFDADNDPFGEHGFGSFDHGGRTILWKIDLYDRGYKFYSPDPTDPARTNRVLTILLAEEY